MATRTLARIGLFALAALLVVLSGVASGHAQTNTARGQQAENQAEASREQRPNGARPTIVLVHGAWDNSTSWDDVIKELQQSGYPVIAPANPLRELGSDSAYVSSILTTIEGPVVLVGHSYGGAVITNAAVGHSNVKALVYIAAFVPDEGESLFQLSSLNPGSEIGPTALIPRPYPITADTVGIDLYLTQEAVRMAFAPDVSRRVANQMFATQRPLTQAAFESASGAPAWKTIPSWYLVASEDRTIAPATQRFMAERAGAYISEVRSSHVAHVSHPHQTLRIILKAADSVD
jgi:pimeloyl-ACP methyl ester carboxylesterase